MTDEQLKATRPQQAEEPRPPFLSRLNARGFRMLQPLDATAVLGAIVVLHAVRFGLPRAGEPWPTYPLHEYAVGFLGATVVLLAVFYFGGLYERELRLGSRPRLPQIVALTAIGILVWGAIALISGRYLIPRQNLAILAVVIPLVVAANRRWARWLRIQREGPPRVLLVGAPDEVNLARKHVQETTQKAQIAGEAASAEGLLARVEATRATDVLLLSGRTLDDIYPEPLSSLESRAVGVLQIVRPADSLLGLRNVREIGGMPFVPLNSHVMPVSQVRLKRGLDLLGLLLLAPITVPLTLFVAAYVAIVGGRPLLYTQRRIGKDGRLFHLIKFRTMYPDAEAETGPVQAAKNDPRVVPGLRWVRDTRLDELPQMWNVLKGEMSLVGPRPERPELAERYERLIPGYSRRHETPPGITGLAQVHGRYHTDPEYKLGHDLQYLVNWSPVMDAQILLRTIFVIVTRQG